MSMHDSMMRQGGMPILMAALGDEQAIELTTPDGSKKFTAIVDDLKVEEVPIIIGNRETMSYRDTCRIMISCAPGTVGVKTRLKVAKYGDPEFYVRSIDAVSETTTVVQAWRESLAKSNRRGSEGTRG